MRKRRQWGEKKEVQRKSRELICGKMQRREFFKGESDGEAKEVVREGGIDSVTEGDEEEMSDLAECCVSLLTEGNVMRISSITRRGGSHLVSSDGFSNITAACQVWHPGSHRAPDKDEAARPGGCCFIPASVSPAIEAPSPV